MILSRSLRSLTSTCGIWRAHTSGDNDAGEYVIESAQRPPGWRTHTSGGYDAAEYVIEAAHRPPGWDYNKLGFIRKCTVVGPGGI